VPNTAAAGAKSVPLPGLAKTARPTNSAVLGLAAIVQVFMTIRMILTQANQFFVDGTASGMAETPDQGAFSNPSVNARLPAKREIRFLPDYLNVGPFNQTFIAIHEAGHFAFEGIDHFAFESPGAPAGGPYPMDVSNTQVRTKNYAALNFDEAMQNADTFAQFALHMGVGTDRRLIKSGSLSHKE
jgi:hypothetical protein